LPLYRGRGKPGRPVGRGEKYSSKVQQRHWLRQGFLGFERPDPCSDKPGRPPCTEFATRGSGVESPQPRTRGSYKAAPFSSSVLGGIMSGESRPVREHGHARGRGEIGFDSGEATERGAGLGVTRLLGGARCPSCSDVPAGSPRADRRIGRSPVWPRSRAVRLPGRGEGVALLAR
jgi:hypothetical protein